MDMRFADVIRKQEDLVAALQERHEADQKLIDAQKDQIRSLNEKITILENEKRDLTDAGNQLAASLGKMDKICQEQQELLESFSKIFHEK